MKTNAAELRPSDTRQRIVDTAARLFYQRGYTLTGINQLIGEAGVAKASLYQHFKSKDDVLLAYLQQVSQDWFRQVDAATANGVTPKEKILAIFDFLNDFLVSVEFRGCNFQNALVQLSPDKTPVRTFIQQHKSKMSDVFARLLSDSTPTLADEITLLFEGALITSQIQQNQEPVNTARRMVERLL